jgi:hypothetical protein
MPAGIERSTVLNILHRVGAGGHNNTQVNPVFRGMVRFCESWLKSAGKRAFNQRKNCD